MLAQFRRLVASTIAPLGLLLGGWALCTVPVSAATLVLGATTDFPVRDAGDAPYYAEQVRGSLAIQASIVEYRGVFARAETVFSGDNGLYNIALIGLAELDGEAVYKLSVNSELIGSSTNPTTNIDYLPISHKFAQVSLRNGDVLAVESIANSNDKIPEGNGFAFARGRWTELRLTPVGETDTQPDKVSLIGNAATLSADIDVGDQITIDFAVLNEDTAIATATDVNIVFDVPEEFAVLELGSCTQTTSTHPGANIVACPIMELPPGDSTTGQLYLVANAAAANLTIQSTVIANEADVDGADNRADLAFTINTPDNNSTIPPAVEPGDVSNPEPDPNSGVEPSPEPNPAISSGNMPTPMDLANSGENNKIDEPVVTTGVLGIATMTVLFLFFLAAFRQKAS